MIREQNSFWRCLIMSEIESAWEKTKSKDFLREERQINHPIRKMIRDNAAGKSVGDFGCASCIDYPMWVNAHYDYTGIDFTEKFLEHAKSLHPNIKLIKSDIINVNLPEKHFDTSYCKDIFEHQPPDKYREVLREMWRLTNKALMVAFYIAPTDKPTRYELVKGIHYKNHYNKQEIINAFQDITGLTPEITEKIGYNNSALYVVKR